MQMKYKKIENVSFCVSYVMYYNKNAQNRNKEEEVLYASLKTGQYVRYLKKKIVGSNFLPREAVGSDI